MTRPVTDPVLLKELAREHIDPATVDFDQDYAVHAAGKRHSPYAKFYRSLERPGLNWMVVSSLPMVDNSGDRLTPGWQFAGPHFIGRKNLFTARIQGRDVELTVRNDDAVGRKQGWTLAYSPRLFVGGVEIPASAPVLVPVDPWNPNYQQNVLEWDYGVCKRKLRTVEGRVHGYWVFPANPGADVLIRYNQAGDYRLKLEQYRQTDDEEFIPASVFAAAEYPFEISDSATYYPDANPETSSVDGNISGGSNLSWANLVAHAGNGYQDDITEGYLTYIYHRTGNAWDSNHRAAFLFDTGGLPDASIISAATLSLYGSAKVDSLSITPNLNIYTSAPASNFTLAAGDYDSFGLAAQSDTAITYAGWSTAGYNDFVLNATGISNISLVGVSKFGARNANYDVTGVEPSESVTWNQSYINAYYAEQGAGFKPKLVVTYTLPKAVQSQIAHRMLSGGFI